MSPSNHRTAFHARPSARRGFTLLELMIGVMVLLMLVGSLMQSLRSMTRGATYASIDGELQAQAEHALRSIISNLKPSGFAMFTKGVSPLRMTGRVA